MSVRLTVCYFCLANACVSVSYWCFSTTLMRWNCFCFETYTYVFCYYLSCAFFFLSWFLAHFTHIFTIHKFWFQSVSWSTQVRRKPKVRINKTVLTILIRICDFVCSVFFHIAISFFRFFYLVLNQREKKYILCELLISVYCFILFFYCCSTKHTCSFQITAL